jgi:hypothetical protein
MSEDWYMAEQPALERRPPGVLCIKICCALFAVWSILVAAQAIGTFAISWGTGELVLAGIGGFFSCGLGLAAAYRLSRRLLNAFDIVLTAESVLLVTTVAIRAFLLHRRSLQPRPSDDTFGYAVIIFGEETLLEVVFLLLAVIAILAGSRRLRRSFSTLGYEPMLAL